MTRVGITNGLVVLTLTYLWADFLNQILKNCSIAMIGVLYLVTPPLSWASRYTGYAPVATAVQKDPLSVVVDLSIPTSEETIGDAVRFLMLRSGYHLAKPQGTGQIQEQLLGLPIPAVHRRWEVVRLDVALRTLAGPSWQMVVDPVRRMISYDLIDRLSIDQPTNTDMFTGSEVSSPTKPTIVLAKAPSKPSTSEASLPTFAEPDKSIPSELADKSVSYKGKIPLTPRKTWRLNIGDTLSGAITRWAKTEDWRVVWDLPVDYPISAPVTLTGSLGEAITAIIGAYCTNGVPIGHKPYPGNQVHRFFEKNPADQCQP